MRNWWKWLWDWRLRRLRRLAPGPVALLLASCAPIERRQTAARAEFGPVVYMVVTTTEQSRLPWVPGESDTATTGTATTKDAVGMLGAAGIAVVGKILTGGIVP